MLIVQLRLAAVMVVWSLLAFEQPNLGTIVVLTLAAVFVAVSGFGVSVTPAAAGAGVAVRRRARSAGGVLVRHSHPDAAGHSRPRAPGAR